MPARIWREKTDDILTGHNIVFDSDHCIQIIDSNSIVLEIVESESESREGSQLVGLSGERWTPETDIQAFASILFELVFCHPPRGEVSTPTNIPDCVRKIIETSPDPISGRNYPFNAILEYNTIQYSVSNK
jgi:hypothetical protein